LSDDVFFFQTQECSNIIYYEYKSPSLSQKFILFKFIIVIPLFWDLSMIY